MKPGDKYPMLFKEMTRKVGILPTFRNSQQIVAYIKLEIKINAYNAYKMNLQISATDYIKEKNEVELNLQ